MSTIRSASLQVQRAEIRHERLQNTAPVSEIRWSFRLERAGFGSSPERGPNDVLILGIVTSVEAAQKQASCEVTHAVICQLESQQNDLTPAAATATVRAALLELESHAAIDHFAQIKTLLALIDVLPDPRAIHVFGEHMKSLAAKVQLSGREQAASR